MNNELITLAITTFTGLFAIMNPLATAPAFVGLVVDRTPDEKKRIAKNSCFYAFIITCCFVILGKYLFQLFGLTIPAFKITGGLLLGYIGFEKLISRESKIQSSKKTEIDESIAISPIAIPILAGPGTLVTAMNVVTNGSMAYMAVVIGVLAILLVLNFIAFRGSAWLMSHLNKNMVQVIGKIMGLILAIIGTGMVISGVKLATI
ncbi:MAG TPA: MarC family protein [Bacteroidaceae bacterium]|nr:MarC family protein [Bacteroidaceae bacterium]